MSPINNTPTIGKFSWKEKSTESVGKKKLGSSSEIDNHEIEEPTNSSSPIKGDKEDQKSETNESEEDSIARRRSRRTRSSIDETPIKLESMNGSPIQRNKKLRIHQPTMMFQCDHCGKVYKHRNCLVKHGWEHHESWHLTMKHCSSKHQQVQMMEAAYVLSDMNGRERNLMHGRNNSTPAV